MKRNIDLDGATNFRDLGGYEASNGSKIKKGLVFRSDHLSNLTIEDINILKELGIKTICDFRSDVDVKRELYQENIEDKYDILFVLDDRNSEKYPVVPMWRELGLTCFQVAEGNF